ncbi:MAG: hypothetical protein VX951_06240 [Planctomycetota bacterium]|nr:hypothetical protein [Planctomycetota bacterium]
MRYLAITLTSLLTIFAVPLIAQGKEKSTKSAEIKLARMVTKADGNPAKLFAAAKFAKKNKLEDHAAELFGKVLAIQPDNKLVNEALGHKSENGKWMAEVKGIWVEVSQKAEALNGAFFHEGKRVNTWEKKQLLKGQVRHKYTGMLIPAADVEKANAGQFPLADGQWGDMAAANKYHSNINNPWALRTRYCCLISSLPYETLSQKVWGVVDETYTKLRMICGGNPCHPDRIPVILVTPTTASYIQFGDAYGGAGSSHGAFHTSAQQFTVSITGNRRPVAACNWDAKGWEPYYARHAAGLAIANSYFGSESDSIPTWFTRGLAGYASRLFSNQMATYFGKQHARHGTPEDLAKWMSGFSISGDNPQTGKGTNDYNIYQAGLLVKFCMHGGDQESTDALMAVTKAMSEGKGISIAVRKLEKVLGTKSDAVAIYLEKITG